MNSIDNKIKILMNLIDSNPTLANKNSFNLYKTTFAELSDTERSKLIYIISATYWILGDNIKAMQFAQKNISNNYSTIGMINSYKILGNIAADLMNYLNALDYYNTGLQLAIDNNFLNEFYAFYSNIGNIYSDIEDYENSIKFYLKAIECTNKSKVNIGLAETNLAETYIYINKLDSALKYIEIAENLLKTNVLNISIANLNTIFAKYFFAKEEFDNAIKYCKLSIDNYNIANNVYRNIENYELLGNTYLITNKKSKAIENYKKAYDITDEFKDYMKKSKFSSKLATLYSEMNDNENALKFYKDYHNAANKKHSIKYKTIKEQIEIKDKIKSIELERKLILKDNNDLIKMNKKIELINSIGKEITLYTDFKRSSYKINALLKKVLNIDFLIISHINSDQNSLKYIELINSDDKKIKMTSDNASIEDTLAMWVINNNKPIFDNNYKINYKKYKKNLRESHKNAPNSVIFIPLKIKNKTIGFFSIQSFKENAYTKDDFDFISTLSPFISISLENSIKSAELINEIKTSEKTKRNLEKANKQLKINSDYDALTNLPNRRYLFSHLKNILNSSFRENKPLTLLIIDIDYFKQYNDNYGHIKGDHCLKKFATILLSSLKRKSDFIARYGGDEFIAILPNTNISGAIKIIEAINTNLRKDSIEHKYSEISNQITLSIGGYTNSGDMKINPRTLIKKADECLYVVKNKGRNGFHIELDDKKESDI